MNNTTEALAARLGIRAQSIRARLCRTGSYFGLRPKTLPNGRLVWPNDAYEQLIAGGQSHTNKCGENRTAA